jgi:hypothetical protein
MLTNRHHADDVKAMAEGDGRACMRQVDSEATGARCARQEHSSACIYVALKQSKSQLILHGPKYGSATLANPALQMKRNDGKSKSNPSARGTVASLASTKPASRRKEATPPASSDSEQTDSGDVVSKPKKKSPRVQFDITPGSGVYIWNRKGDGPKFGFTTEALDHWLQPIIIKKDSNPDA